MANRKYRYEDMQPVLERLLQDKESDELEFKTAAGGFPKSFGQPILHLPTRMVALSSSV